MRPPVLAGGADDDDETPAAPGQLWHLWPRRCWLCRGSGRMVAVVDRRRPQLALTRPCIAWAGTGHVTDDEDL